MKLTKLFLSAIVLLILCACTQTKKAVEANNIVLNVGSVCGWCAGSDSLYISSGKIHYAYKPLCGKKELIKDSAISREDLSRLVESLDINAFGKIDLNTCAVCADGCDTWISVKQGKFYHKITFDNIDYEQLKPVRDFVEKITSFKKRIGVR